MGAGHIDMSRYMEMFMRHSEISRVVEDIPGGVRTTTESKSPDLTAQLQAHVSSIYAHDRRPGCCWSPRPCCSSCPGRPGPASRPDQVLCRVAFARLIFTHSRNPQGLPAGRNYSQADVENHLPQMILPPKIVCRADDLTCRTLLNPGGCLLCRTSCSDGRSPRGVSPGPETKNSNAVVA